METKEGAPRSNRVQLLQLIMGTWVSQAIYAVTKAGVADKIPLVKDGAASVGELAEACTVDPSALYRFLRALACFGLVVENEAGCFSLTDVGALLHGEHPHSLQPMALMQGGEFYRAWGQVEHSLNTGMPAFDKVFGQSLFEHLKGSPSGVSFDACMAKVHAVETEAVLRAYDFASVRTLVDVGGGQGSFIVPALTAHPHLTGLILDLPEVVPRAKAALEKSGLSGRCEVLGGSFFDSVPAGADAYVLQHVVHDWADEKAVRLLSNCRRAMKRSSRLIIIDSVLPEGPSLPGAKLMDLHMLVLAGGLERTERQFNRLLNQSGFRLKQVIPTAVPRVSLVEACPEGMA